MFWVLKGCILHMNIHWCCGGSIFHQISNFIQIGPGHTVSTKEKSRARNASHILWTEHHEITPFAKLKCSASYPKVIHSKYRTRAIITRGLYIVYPNFHCGLYCRAVSATDNLWTKQGNSSNFGPKLRGFCFLYFKFEKTEIPNYSLPITASRQ